MRRATGAAAALLASLAVVAPAGAAQRLVLDLGDPLNASPKGALTTTAPLAKGEAYILTVVGTGSAWPAGELDPGHSVCGVPEGAPIAPSPGKPNSSVGVDPEVMFAAPAGAVLAANVTCRPGVLPRSAEDLYTGFEVSLGGNRWQRLQPIGGARMQPRADHTYVYELTGAGAPAAFRYVDTPSDDNYGRFGLTLITAAECEKIGCEGSAKGSGFSALTAGDTRKAPSPAGNPAAGETKVLPTCAQTLPVKLKTSAGTLRSAKLTAGGKKLTTLTKSTVRKQAILRRLPAKKFKLTVTGKTTAGRTVKATKTISGCRKATKRATTLTLR